MTQPPRESILNPMLGVLNLIDPHIAWPQTLTAAEAPELYRLASALLVRAQQRARVRFHAEDPDHALNLTAHLVLVREISAATIALEPSWRVCSQWFYDHPRLADAIRTVTITGLAWRLMTLREQADETAVIGFKLQLLDACFWTLTGTVEQQSAALVVRTLTETGWAESQPGRLDTDEHVRIFTSDRARSLGGWPQTVTVTSLSGRCPQPRLILRVDGETVDWTRFCSIMASGMPAAATSQT